VQLGFEQVHGFEEGFLLAGGELVQDAGQRLGGAVEPLADQDCLAGDDLDDRAPPVGRVGAPLDQGVQPASGGVRVTGSLTVRGRTRPLSFDAKVSAAEDEVRLDAEVPVNRAEFGLTYNPVRMTSMNNTITVHAVFTRQ
jgi:YceI-like domain